MGIFSKLQFSVDFGTRLPWKEKQAVRRALLDNDGTLSYILTKKVIIIVLFDLLGSVNGSVTLSV